MRIGGLRYSPQFTKITGALLEAQKNIKVALKDANNPHFKSRYADLASVFDACKDALNNAGIVFVQAPSSTKNEVTITTTLFSQGEWLACQLTAPLSKYDAQSVGSAITYLRRYSLSSIAGVVSDDDDGQAAVGAPALAVQQKNGPHSVGVNAEARKEVAPKAPPQPGEWVVPWGKQKGTPVSQLEDSGLAWLLNYYQGKNEPENLNAVQTEAKKRGIVK